MLKRDFVFCSFVISVFMRTTSRFALFRKVIKVKAKRCAKIVHISIVDILLYLWQNYTFFPTRQTFCKVFYIYVPLFPQPKPFYFSTSSSQICGFAVFLPKDT